MRLDKIMKILKQIDNVRNFTNNSTVVIGNFDGVHLGHKKIIREAKNLCGSNKIGIITFEPHPRDYFARNKQPFKLTSIESKYGRLKDLGVDFIVELEFNHQLENYSPIQFVEIILHHKLGIKNIMVGQNFRFGNKRSGDFKKLKQLGQHFDIHAFKLDLEHNGEKAISSTRIRTALEFGRVQEARNMLGYWHKIYGKIIHGDHRGRELGFPTANIELEGILVPRFGVYSSIVEVLSGKFAGVYKGASSIGEKPTFGENEKNLEVFIFDFSQEIYGEKVAISLINFQRPEEKFNNIDNLIDQMHKDCEKSRINLSSFDMSGL